MNIKLPGGAGGLAVLAAVGLAGFYVMRQRLPPATAQASAGTRKRVPAQQGINRVQTYANPQTMGELLARQVVGMVGGFLPRRPSVATQDVGNAEARAAIRMQEGSGYYGWQGPTITPVDPGAAAQYGDGGEGGDPYWGGMVDSIPAGPVYDVTTDIAEYAWAGDFN